MRTGAKRRLAAFLGIATILFPLLFLEMAASVELNVENSGKIFSGGSTIYADNLQKQSNSLSPSNLVLNKVNASKKIQSSVVEPLLSKVNPDNGLSVLEYPDALPAGTKIEPAFTTPNMTKSVVITRNPCKLNTKTYNPLRYTFFYDCKLCVYNPHP